MTQDEEMIGHAPTLQKPNIALKNMRMFIHTVNACVH